jgi:hypothetical protein
MTSRDAILRHPTAIQLTQQHRHVIRARDSLRRALRAADGPESVHLFRALTDLARYLKEVEG